MAQPSPTDAWAESLPQATDPIADGDDEIRDLSRRIRERSNRGGHAWNEATLTEAGRHSLGHGSGSTGVGDLDGEFAIYDQDVSTKIVRVTNADAAIAAANRNRFILDGTVITGLRNVNGIYESDVADGGSAVAFLLDNLTTLSTAGALLMDLQNNGVSKFTVDKDGKLSAAGGGFRQAISGWFRTTINAGQTNQLMKRYVQAGATAEVTIIRPGSIVGVSILITGPRTAGQADFEVTLNGAGTGFMCTFDGSSEDTSTTTSATQDAGLDAIVAGDKIGIRYTTDGSWAPTGNVAEGMVEIDT